MYFNYHTIVLYCNFASYYINIMIIQSACTVMYYVVFVLYCCIVLYALYCIVSKLLYVLYYMYYIVFLCCYMYVLSCIIFGICILYIVYVLLLRVPVPLLVLAPASAQVEHVQR